MTNSPRSLLRRARLLSTAKWAGWPLALALTATVGLTCTPSSGGSGTGGSNGSGSGGGNGSGSGGNNGSGSGGSSGSGSGGNNGSGSGGSNGSGSGGSSGSGTGGGSGSGTGGSSNTDGGVAPSFAYTFDTTVEGFALSDYANASRKNLAAADSGSTPTLTHDSAEGDPSPGSLKVAATFTDYAQYVDAVVNVSPALDLTGKTVHARVRLTSGTFTGGATLHVSTTTSYVYGAGTWTTLTAGEWKDLTVDLSKVTASGWDASQVVQIGISFDTGDQPEAGAFEGPNDVVFNIDLITDGTGGGTAPALSHTFDTSAQGYVLNDYADMNSMNLAAPDSGSMPTLTFDSTAGDPSPGSLKATVTFSDYKQYIDAIANLSPARDLSGKILHARVRLTSGTFTGGVVLHASTTTSYVYGGGTWTTLEEGTWTDLTLDLGGVTASGWDASQVVQVGVSINTGDQPEAGSFMGPNDVVINIDSVTVE